MKYPKTLKQEVVLLQPCDGCGAEWNTTPDIQGVVRATRYHRHDCKAKVAK